MNKFKSIIMSYQGKSKTFLHWLYNTHVDDDDEDEETNDDTFYSSYSPEAEAKAEDDEGFPIEDE